MAARPAHAAAQPSAAGPADTGAPLTRTVQPGVQPTTLAWHDTYFYWDNAVTANTLGIGQAYQSRDPVYELTFGLRPRYYFVDEPNESISLRADLGIVSERTNSDTTTEEGEWSATDFELYGALADELRRSADDITELSLRLPRLILPTSKISYDSGKILGLGTRVALREDVALEGRSEKFFPNLELFAKVEYDHQFTRAETPTNSGLERIRLDPDGRSVVSDQLSGATFAHDAVDFGVAASLHVHQDVLWATSADVRPGWKYPVDHEVEICGVVLTGCAQPTGVSNPQTHSALTSFTSSLLFTLNDTFGLSFGYANITAQLAPDGRRRSIFYSPDARFYATLSVGLDHLYSDLSHRDRQSASLAGASHNP